jgi:hypothetical protein
MMLLFLRLMILFVLVSRFFLFISGIYLFINNFELLSQSIFVTMTSGMILSSFFVDNLYLFARGLNDWNGGLLK